MSDEQASAARAYRGFIDRVVLEVRPAAALSATDANAERVLSGLDADGRSALAAVLQATRDSAIHDVLAELSWQLDTGRLELHSGVAAIDVDEVGSGMGLHGDFVGRLDGWQWPAD